MPISEVFNMDCMDGMKQFEDGFFDLAVVDPPYFSGPEKREYYGSRISTTKVKRRQYHVIDTWEVPGKNYFQELERVSKRYIVWGCNYFDYRFSSGRIVWDKCNGSNTFSDCEIAATNIHDSVRLYRYMWNGMMQGKSMDEGHIQRGNKSTNEVRFHPTQKPVELYKWIFRNYAKDGYKILDTHLGSGSSRIAAYDAGLDFWGYEIDEYYFSKMQDRFEDHASQLRMDF